MLQAVVNRCQRSTEPPDKILQLSARFGLPVGGSDGAEKKKTKNLRHGEEIEQWQVRYNLGRRRSAARAKLEGLKKRWQCPV